MQVSIVRLLNSSHKMKIISRHNNFTAFYFLFYKYFTHYVLTICGVSLDMGQLLINEFIIGAKMHLPIYEKMKTSQDVIFLFLVFGNIFNVQSFSVKTKMLDILHTSPFPRIF